MGTRKNYWDLVGRPHTRLKLDIYSKYVDAWLSIFCNQPWASEVFIVDCFAGRGDYDLSGKQHTIAGSPLIAVNASQAIQEKFYGKPSKNKSHFKVKCFFIEKSPFCIKHLHDILRPYRNEVNYEIICGDFNQKIDEILKKIGNKPTLFFVDPCGIKGLKRESVAKIVRKKGGRDIMLNYIQEGVERISGLTKRAVLGSKEIKTLQNLNDFIGPEAMNLIGKTEQQVLKYYVDEVLKGNNENVDKDDRLKVLAFDMPYPHKRDTIYYLLFASRKDAAIKIVRDVYTASKKTDIKTGHESLFSSDELSKSFNDFNM